MVFGEVAAVVIFIQDLIQETVIGQILAVQLVYMKAQVLTLILIH